MEKVEWRWKQSMKLDEYMREEQGMLRKGLWEDKRSHVAWEWIRSYLMLKGTGEREKWDGKMEERNKLNKILFEKCQN